MLKGAEGPGSPPPTVARVMSSSPETPTRTTGAHRAHGRRATALRRARWRSAPPARYEPYLDGLFTYCLSVLCDHDAATAALGEVLALAERAARAAPSRPGTAGPGCTRWPAGPACASWPRPSRNVRAPTRPAATARAAELRRTRRRRRRSPRRQRRRELALLAWPEAAGTTPEQREALELAVRHQLAAHEVAAVLGMDLAERPRTARLRRLRGRAHPRGPRRRRDRRAARASPGSPATTSWCSARALRRELVRHVDDCPRCRRTAERAGPGRWPGGAVTPGRAARPGGAPRGPARRAGAPPRARGAAPRFDRRGFPMDPKDRAARRDRLRARAVTTTVVATVVAAPVLALWAAYRGAPDRRGHRRPLRHRQRGDGPGSLDGEARAAATRTRATPARRPGRRFAEGSRTTGRLREVISVAAPPGKGAGHLAVSAADAATPRSSPSPRPAAHRSAGPRPRAPPGSTSAVLGNARTRASR